MCGIAGIVGRQGPDPKRNELVRRMTSTLVHRGPDGEGYADLDGCSLGFRRLSIVDIDGSIPPYSNEDGTICTVCNGEIYNSQELRARLEAQGHTFHSNVDTEVLPHLYEEYGADLVSQLDGMFAFAIWDESRRILVLGRDRAGEKPLFYWTRNGEFAFASELRAILTHPEVQRTLDPVGLQQYLLHDFFPAPVTPITAVHKLPAAHFLVLSNGEITIRRYWDLADYFTIDSLPEQNFEETADELGNYISRAISRRKRSDVPVGIFLSGGLDSSTLLAYLARQEGQGIPVFSLGHADHTFDESRFARETARHFHADYHELILDESDLAEGLRKVGKGFDEPLGDTSTIPTHLLSQFARHRVKVILSGEGGDELFAGYPTYLGDRYADLYCRLPLTLRHGLQRFVRSIVPVSMGNNSFDYLLSRFLDGVNRDRIARHHCWFGSLSPERQARLLCRRLLEQLSGEDPFRAARQMLSGKKFPDSLSELLYTDFTMYLQDNLLTKVDRASMLASLEARAPFLDHELAEYVAGLPSVFKLRGIMTKAILRQTTRSMLPADILKRRKRGFNIPFSRWLLSGLGEKLRSRFSAERVNARGIFNPSGVKELLEEHLSGNYDHRKPIYTLLAFDLWCDKVFGEGQPVPVGNEKTTSLTSTGSAQ